MSPAELSEATGISSGVIRTTLRTMMDRGQLIQPAYGSYTVPMGEEDDLDVRMIRRMLDASGYAVIMLDRESTIIHATQSYKDVFKISGVVSGRKMEHVFPSMTEQQRSDLAAASAGAMKRITDPYEYEGVWFLYENHNWYRGNGKRGGFVSIVTTGKSKDTVPPVPGMPFINDHSRYIEKGELPTTTRGETPYAVGQKTPSEVTETLLELIGEGRSVKDAYLIKQFFYHLIDWTDMETIVRLEGGKAEPINQKIYMEDESGNVYRVNVGVTLELLGNKADLEREGVRLPPEKNKPRQIDR